MLDVRRKMMVIKMGCFRKRSTAGFVSRIEQKGSSHIVHPNQRSQNTLLPD
jgi:hypothetical protein